MKALFIGGTGIISSGCAPLALESGFELTLLNRGQSFRAAPEGAEVLVADYSDQSAVEKVLSGRDFDVIVNWIAYTPDQVKRDVEMFRGRTGQYIFISSASAYQKPPRFLPITESTPLENPFWEYSRNKAACEEALMDAYFTSGFPTTIVRPSHTYDKTLTPLPGGKTMLHRLFSGKPVIVHGDGTSLWILTHHKDFAKGFVGLMSNPLAVGEAFHITSDELLTWNRIADLIASAAGVEPKIVHLTSETINRYDPEWGAGLIGDKANSVIFDNSKIKNYVPSFKAEIPFHRGAREIVDWYKSEESGLEAGVDPELEGLIEKMIAENQ